MPPKKYYVVWKGHKTGIFNTWDECKKQVHGFDGAQYKSFKSLSEAKESFKKNYWSVVSQKSKTKTTATKNSQPDPTHGLPDLNSISVDAACSGNPGTLEYQAVDTKTKANIFKAGPFKKGTNNIGEFLAIVDGLKYIKKNKIDTPIIYSDSKVAMLWVNKKHCRTKLKKTATNKELFERISEAENWLSNNSYTTKILKWHTSSWGEIPADFGRK